MRTNRNKQSMEEDQLLFMY